MAGRYRKVPVKEAPRRSAAAPYRYGCAHHGWVVDTCLPSPKVWCACGRVAKKESA